MHLGASLIMNVGYSLLFFFCLWVERQEEGKGREEIRVVGNDFTMHTTDTQNRTLLPR